MTAEKPLIALISATPFAIPPAESAVFEEFGEVDIWNILDDRLMVEAEASGGLTPALASRMETLIEFAISQGADAALLTCSLYGPVAAQHRRPIPVLPPDGAVFDDVIQSDGRHVMVVASFEDAMQDSVGRLREAVAASGRTIRISGVTVPAAKTSAKAADPAALVGDLAAAIESSGLPADIVLLAQYSLAPARRQLEERIGRPVLAAPVSAAVKLRSDIADAASSGVLGVIADDYTGAIDVADALHRAGLRTLLLFGLEEPPVSLPDHDAVVVALKTRSVPPDEAVDSSLSAAEYLRRQAADQIYFKYCSTFDSTPRGNIGPVLDALSNRLGVTTVLTTPSSPRHRRTVCDGLLYVDGVLLEESHMARHPLNPMTDSLLPRLLAAQSELAVHAIPLETVRASAEAVRAKLDRLSGQGRTLVVADADTEDDLAVLAAAQSESPLLAGAAGLALAVGEARARRSPRVRVADGAERSTQDRAAVFAGSCSASTLDQIARFRERGFPAHQLVAAQGMTVETLVDAALRWYERLPEGAVPLFFSSVDVAELARIHRDLGDARVSEIFEEALARIAAALRDRGIDRFVVAGGETSGAVTRGLGVNGGIMGDHVDEGVAWLHATTSPPLALLLKSGNFGEPDLFIRATDPEQTWGASND